MRKIRFEYLFQDKCYGEVRIQNECEFETEVDGEAEIVLPPCSKHIKISENGDGVTIAFSRVDLVQATAEGAPFEYSEDYEMWEDVREMSLAGRVRVIG